MNAARLAFFYGAIFLVIGVMLPFWPLWLKAHGLGPEEIGLVMGVAMATKVVGNPLIAGIADRLNERKRPLIVLSFFACGAFSIFHGMTGFWPILAISILFFFFWSPLIPLTETLTMLISRRQKLDYGRVRLWGSLTFIAAALGMGWALTDRSPELIYWTILVMIGLTFAAALFLPNAEAPPRADTRAPIVEVLKDRMFLVFIAATGLIQTSHVIYYAFGTIHWRAAGHSEAVIGWLWAEGVIAEVLLFIWGDRVIRKIGAARLIALAGLAGLIRWLGTGLTDALPALVILQLLHGATYGAAHLGAIHFISRRMDPAISATAQGVYAAAVMGIGFGIASWGGGYLYAAHGGHAYLPMALMAGLGGWVAFSLRRQPPDT